MKYIVIIGDGMADYPIPQLDNKTPLQYAQKPNIDYLARYGKVGLVKTVPEGIPPGSDSANLSVMGYDPRQFYTGRSPLEAVSMGVELSETDVALRCNLVTLSDDESYENKVMIDYSSDEISSDESEVLISDVNRHFKNDIITYFSGISYRHCMVWKNGPIGLGLIPPHDILERKIGSYLPKGAQCKILLDMMIESNKFLENHPINKARVLKGLRPATSIWLWGEGKKPQIPSFSEKYQIRGSVISAVDLIKGIGLCAGLESIDVEGVTGNINTNFIAKAEAALMELEKGQDFVYVHIEAPDECGHRYEIDNKVKSIELIDQQVVSTILKGVQKYDDFRIMILPDHPTPLSLRTHTSDPVPFVVYQKSRHNSSSVNGYDEFQAKDTRLCINDGYKLMDLFIKGDI
jgi:2,3-bisphosphoglycerate-independent phosphoglycerate mutase